MFSLFRRCSSWSTAVGSSLCRSRCAELETSSKVLRESGFPIRKLPLVNTKIYLEDVTVHKQAIPSRHGVRYAAPFDEAKPTLPSPRFDHGAAVHADRYLLIFAGPLSMNDLQVTHLPTLEAIPSMVAGVWSEESTLQLEATTQFRKSSVSNERSPPIKEVIQSGVVPRFVEFLMRKDFLQLQFEAAWALTNIASGTSEDTRVVIDHGTVPIFVKILSSPSDDVHEQAVWALGNVAGDSPKCHGLVLGNGISLPGPMRRRAVTLFQRNHMAFQLNFRRYFTPSLSDCYQIREQGLLTQRAIWYCRDIIWNCVRRHESGIRTASFDPSTVKFNGVSYSLDDGTEPIIPIGGIEGGLYKLLMHALGFNENDPNPELSVIFFEEAKAVTSCEGLRRLLENLFVMGITSRVRFMGHVCQNLKNYAPKGLAYTHKCNMAPVEWNAAIGLDAQGNSKEFIIVDQIATIGNSKIEGGLLTAYYRRSSNYQKNDVASCLQFVRNSSEHCNQRDSRNPPPYEISSSEAIYGLNAAFHIIYPFVQRFVIHNRVNHVDLDSIYFSGVWEK